MLWIGKFVQWELKQRHSYSLCETEAFYQARRQTSYFSWRPGRQRSRCFNSWVGRGVVLLGILGGVVPPGSLIFPIRFQTRSLKSVPISDLAFRQKWCYHYLDYSANKKTSSNPFRIRMFLFLFYSFGIETITSYTPVVPSKTIPDSRPKWAKCLLVFRPKRCKNPTRPMGRHIPI